MGEVLLSIGTQLCIYLIVIAGLNLISGYAGVFSVSQGLQFGIGAFTYAGFVRFWGINELLVALPVAALAAGVFSILLGRVSLRVSGDHFIVASFGAQIAGLQVIYNWRALSGGGPGAFGLPEPTLAGLAITGSVTWLALGLAAAAAVMGMHAWIARSPFGIAVRAMRDDADALMAGGLEPLPLMAGSFAVGGASAAVAGVLFAGFVTVAQVADYTLAISISLLAAVIAGGAGTIRGSFLGVALFIGIPRLLDLLDAPTEVAGVAQQLAFGVLLVVVMLALPKGLAQLRVVSRAREIPR